MKPGLKTLIVGIFFIVLGVFVIPVAFIAPFLISETDEHLFLVPGETETEVDEPGRYYLWNDFQTVFEGRTYNRSKTVPDGLEIVVETAQNGKLPFIPDNSLSTSSGSSAKNSIGYVEITTPGTVTISVTGNAEPRVFSFSPFNFAQFLGLIFGAFAVSALVSLAGIGLTIWGIIKLAKGRSNNDSRGGQQ